MPEVDDRDNDFNKIIAIRFGSKILFGISAINMLHQMNDEYDQILSVAEFKMMSRMDFGDKWGKYAECAPVLFMVRPGTTPDERNPKPYTIRRF